MTSSVRFTFFPVLTGLLEIAVSSIVLVSHDYSEDGIRAVLRFTAHCSAVLFATAFSASAIRSRLPGPLTAALIVNRRAVGLAFATSHVIHAIAIAMLTADTGLVPETTTLAVGGIGYLFIAAMAATSSDRAVRALGPAKWRKLHLAGSWYLWFVFMATYLPVYLWREVGYSETAAGLTFATLHIAGIVSRIVLGGIADRWVSSRVILIAIAGVMALTLVTIGYFEKDWPMALILLVIFIAGASGNGWVGLFFAELARLSPGDQTASVAAGSQFLMYLGIVGGPAFFGALLGASGSYLFAFYVFGGISLLCGLPLLFTRSPKTD